jgi:hypothetical protein
MTFLIFINLVLEDVSIRNFQLAQLTYVVPVGAAHDERPVSLFRQPTQFSVTNDVREGEATFPQVAPLGCVKFERIRPRKVVPGSK